MAATYMTAHIPKLTMICQATIGEFGTMPPITNTVTTILIKSRSSLAVFSLCSRFMILSLAQGRVKGETYPHPLTGEGEEEGTCAKDAKNGEQSKIEIHYGWRKDFAC
jgi:hypothetical protein